MQLSDIYISLFYVVVTLIVFVELVREKMLIKVSL